MPELLLHVAGKKLVAITPKEAPEWAKPIIAGVLKIYEHGHEKLDVYQLAINYVAWVFEMSRQLNGIHRHGRDQWLRASQSIPLMGIMLSRLGKRGYEVGEEAETYGDCDLDFDCDLDSGDEQDTQK